MTLKNSKVRLDRLLIERKITRTRERARALILSGAVIVSENRIDKAATLVSKDAEIRIKGGDNQYVSRGGLKLKGALTEFSVDVAGLVALDVGASTGGFTDCLLQEGARKVYAVDVVYGQLAWKLRNDERVIVFERTNIRYFSGNGIVDEIDIATIDASFISLKLVIPAVLKFIKKDAQILALIKPQFEVGKREVGKKGVVKDPQLHRRVVHEIAEFCSGLKLKVIGTCESTILGPAGNKEFFIYVKRDEN